MAEIFFNPEELFEKAFGYKTQAFFPVMKHIKGTSGLVPRDRTEFGAHGSEYYAHDALGREYFMPVKLAYEDKSGKGQGMDTSSSQSAIKGGSTGKLKEWSLPYPVITVSSKKMIVETPLTERKGTVKELINISNYEIVIKGFLISGNNEFPEQDVTMLRTLYEQNVPISIKCPITDIFLLRPDRSGSDSVLITELKFPSLDGVKHVRPYELHMVSDEPFNLISITGS